MCSNAVSRQRQTAGTPSTTISQRNRRGERRQTNQTAIAARTVNADHNTTGQVLLLDPVSESPGMAAICVPPGNGCRGRMSRHRLLSRARSEIGDHHQPRRCAVARITGRERQSGLIGHGVQHGDIGGSTTREVATL